MFSCSSVELEYKDNAKVVGEIMWIYHLLTKVGLKTSMSTKLWCDNQVALYIASNPIFHKRTKYTEIC